VTIPHPPRLARKIPESIIIKYDSRTSQPVYDLNLHLLTIPKYHRPVFFKDEALRVLNLIGEIYKTRDDQIITDHIFSGHENLFIAIPPAAIQQPSDGTNRRENNTPAVQGKSYKAKDFWDRHLYKYRCLTTSSGNITDKGMKRYLMTLDFRGLIQNSTSQ
jgi:REP element-mobilizing transposase RayT